MWAQLPLSVVTSSQLTFAPAPSGGDDTAAINALTAAASLVILRPNSTYLCSTLLVGGFGSSGAKLIIPSSTIVYQISGSTGYIITNRVPGTDQHLEVQCDGIVTGYNNQTNNTGGIVLTGARYSKISGIGSVSYTNGAGCWIQAYGLATSGDAMFCTIEDIEVQNIVSGACFRATPSANGSHPDSFTCRRTKANSNTGTWYQVDAPSGTNQGCGSPYLEAISGEASASGGITALDVTCQSGYFNIDWFENVAGALTITIEAGTGSFPALGNKIIANTLSTSSLVYNDLSGTCSFVGIPKASGIPGNLINNAVTGAAYPWIATDRIGVFGAGGQTLLSVYSTMYSIVGREGFVQHVMKPMAGPPALTSGVQSQGFGVDNNYGAMIVAHAGGGVNTWIDNGSTVAISNVLDDGTGATSFASITARGLTGATAASRYAGATSSGAPASGTFAVGDFVIDHTGVIWICTTAGTPGTWTGGGVTTFNTRAGAVVPASGDYTAAQVTNAADKSSASQQTFTGNVSAPAYIASGLTGATAASRYAGATASGAPSSGTFAKGDFVIDQTGKVWICTAAGTPGTWWAETVSFPAVGYSISPIGFHSTFTPALNRLHAIPLQVPIGSTWDRAGIQTTASAGAGGVCAIDLYADNGSSLPGALIGTFGTVDTTVAAGALNTSVLGTPLQAPSPIIWVAPVFQTATTTVVSYSGPTPFVAADQSAPTSSPGAYFQNNVSGARPNPWGAVSVSGAIVANAPVVAIRRAA